MKFASTRLVAADIKAHGRLLRTGDGPSAPNGSLPSSPRSSRLPPRSPSGASKRWRYSRQGSAEPAANRTAIIEFQVDDVDAEFARLKDKVEVVHEPKMMPWGNRAAQFRDPEGTLCRHVYAGYGRGEGAVRFAVEPDPTLPPTAASPPARAALRSALIAYSQATIAAANIRQAAKT